MHQTIAAASVIFLTATMSTNALAQANKGNYVLSDCNSWLAEPTIGSAVNRVTERLENGLLEGQPQKATEVFQNVKNALSNEIKTWGGYSKQIVGLGNDLSQMERSELKRCLPRVEAALDKLERTISVRNEQEEEEGKPKGMLLIAYGNYIGVSKCYASRQGYAIRYVQDNEFDFAKKAIKIIEGEIVKQDPSINKDQVWAAANAYEYPTPVNEMERVVAYHRAFGVAAVEGREFNQYGKNYCDGFFTALRDHFRMLSPAAAVPKRDF
ncbi:hypothetical protein [Methylobacterium sp. WL19]|uniref:hypothetical protein n=1 Tax=Methylobacterium sp. WL19 TaxID=2603896 RepID=UPI0011CCBF35|nr:hypothetical protein [Methylobacterium sp. WL19]TXN29123.1 hypothetical protein FV220_07560 [Methylobacterium sp. WL19]